MNEELKLRIAKELKFDPADLTSDKLLADSDFWDSVMVLTLMFIIGEAVGKPILPEEAMNLRTYGDIEKLVASKQS